MVSKKSILKNTVIQNTIRFWVIQMHKPCSLTSIAHIFKSLMRGFCASAASISFCASGLLIASDSRALAALTWQRVFVLFAKETSGFTAPLATTRSWFSRWSLAKELRQAAVLAWRFFDLAPEKFKTDINIFFVNFFCHIPCINNTKHCSLDCHKQENMYCMSLRSHVYQWTLPWKSKVD